MMSRTINVADFGAQGDGITDDWAALQAALDRAFSLSGCLYLPAGRYKHTLPLQARGNKPVAIRGDGENVSLLVAHNSDGLNCAFGQEGARQPWGLTLQSVGFHAVGRAGTAIKVSYGDPSSTIDHRQPSTVLRNVRVVSDDFGSWGNGIDVTAAWNCTLTDVYVSGGDPVNNDWNTLSGSGIRMNRMCVNSHLLNVRCNNWASGFDYDAAGGRNTEGLFFTNCSMVGVKRGVVIAGNPSLASAPRVSTFTWTGGMIECRVRGVKSLPAAFHLKHVWTGLIVGCQMLADEIPDALTYGVLLEECAGVIVTGCDINAWHYGVHTAGPCRAISSHGNTYTNVAKQNIFPDGAVGCRSYGHVYFNNQPMDWAADPKANALGFTG